MSTQADRALGNGTATAPVAVQRCDRFVARTMNWLYDHLLSLPDHRPLILCDDLENRVEFPELTAWSYRQFSLINSIGRKLGIRPPALLRTRRSRPAVLHSHFAYVAQWDFDLRSYLGVPWVVAFYGADAYQSWPGQDSREMYAKLFASCDRVLALGPAMAKRLAFIGCPEDKITVHPLGVSLTDIPSEPRRWDGNGPIEVLFAGTIREKKGVQYALRGAAAARDAGIPVRLTLVGEPLTKQGDQETEQEVRGIIAELGMENCVRRLPLLEFRKLLELSRDCHIFLAPSVVAANGDSEGTPFVLQQMMASGMPVITTRHSDIPFIMGKHEHLLLDERDHESIGARIAEYAQSPDLIPEHGRMMRKRMEDALDVRNCAAKLSEIYSSL